MDKKVSVVIPVYGVEKYLDDCVSSVVNQSYTNIEIILVDDGSKDKCPEICDSWSHRDNRIKVIHKDNQGLAKARKTGWDVASGDYIVNLDSDDWIDNNHINDMLEAAIVNDADIVICDYCINYKKKEVKLYNNIIDFNGKANSLLCLKHKIHAGVVFRMIKRDFFQSLHMPNPMHDFYEDMFTSIFCQNNTDKIVHVSINTYHYRYNEKSLSNDDDINKRIKMHCQSMENIIYLNKVLELDKDLEFRKALLVFFNKRKYIFIYENRRHLNKILPYISKYYPKSIQKDNIHSIWEYCVRYTIQHSNVIPLLIYYYINKSINIIKRIK